MRARNEFDAQLMAIGAAALRLRQRGIPWHRIGPALGGFNSMTVRRLASTYLLRSTLQDLAAQFAARTPSNAVK